MVSPPDAQVFSNGRLNPPTEWMIVMQSILAAMATFFVGWRMYARISLKKRVAVDDIFVVIGLVRTMVFVRLATGRVCPVLT